MRPDPVPLPSDDSVVPVRLCPLTLRRKIAEELDQLREDMEELGVQLCLDEQVMLRCMTHLQRLDELGQRSIWLAELLRSDDPESVIADITLQSLADRLTNMDDEKKGP